jgi:hypothetical protein
VSIDDLGEAREVPPRPRGLARLIAALIGAGLGVGILVAVAAGFCRLTWAPCTSLSLASVEDLAGVDLPSGTQVVSGYAQESARSTVFRAEVRLPDGTGSPLWGPYTELVGPQPVLVPAAQGSGLSGLSYWDSSTGASSGRAAAAQGVDDRGRTVILFDTRLEF